MSFEAAWKNRVTMRTGAIDALDALAGSTAAILEADLAPHRAATHQLLRRLRIALGGSPGAAPSGRPGPRPQPG